MSLDVADIDLPQLLEYHNEGLRGWAYDEHIRRDGYSLVFSALIEDSYYNHLCAGPETTVEACLAEEDEFRDRGRQLAVYVPYATTLGDDLAAAGFSVAAKDVWMVCALESMIVPAKKLDGVETVIVDGTNEADVVDFLDAFSASFSGADPEDPYGPLDETYRAALERAVRSGGNPAFPGLSMLARVNDEPAAMAHIISCGDWIGGYGLGTVPSARRQGVGELLRGITVKESQARGATKFFMQTEYGSRNHKMFMNQGWGLTAIDAAPFFVRAS